MIQRGVGKDSKMGTNPFAAQAVAGLTPQVGGDYVDVDFTYVYDVDIAPATILANQIKGIQNDSDFVWRAIHYCQPDPTKLGAFRMKFSDAQGFYHSDGMILQQNFSNNPAEPTPIMPEIIFPRGGQIGIDIQNLDPALNSQVQICFRGVKRFRVAQQ
jgi:hypothetical protein